MIKPSKEQIRICQGVNVTRHPPDPKSKLGISDPFSNEQYPINGLRHPPKNNSNGWYIWSGEDFSQASDYFKPLHTFHLNDYCPEITKFLALPPGWRFLYTPDYQDIWFDEKLLDV